MRCSPRRHSRAERSGDPRIFCRRCSGRALGRFDPDEDDAFMLMSGEEGGEGHGEPPPSFSGGAKRRPEKLWPEKECSRPEMLGSSTSMTREERRPLESLIVPPPI